MAKRSKQLGHRPSEGSSSKEKRRSGSSVPKGLFSPKWKWIIAAAMAILAMAVYAPSYNYDFVYDDDAVIKENRFVQQGLGGLSEIWTTSYFEGYSEQIKARAYRPIPLSTLAIEYEWFGLNATANHLSNILMYGLSALLLFLLLAELLRNHHPALPVLITLLFVLHPIHIEVVANIKSRDTILGFLGFASAALLLLRYLERPGRVWLMGLSMLCYALGVFSKESALTQLAVFPLLLWFFRGQSLPRVLLFMLPYLLVSAVYLFIRIKVLGGINEGVTLTALDNSLLAAKTPGIRIASNILVLGIYLFKTIVPHPLLSDYSYLTIPLVGWDDWRVYASFFANAGLLALGVYGFFKRKLYGFGALHYFITVSMFTSIIVTNVSAYNDRFLYEPVLGISFLVGWFISRLFKPVGQQGSGKPVLEFAKQNALPIGLMLLLCSLAYGKIATHLPVWKNRYVLFAHDSKLAPNNARSRKNHGGSLARLAIDNQQSNPTVATEYARQAVEELQKALMIYENIPTGHIHLGNMYIILKEYDKAEQSLTKALQYAPESYFARSSLANLMYRSGRYHDVINMINTIDPSLLRSNDYYLLSLTWSKLGDDVQAAEYRKLSGR